MTKINNYLAIKLSKNNGKLNLEKLFMVPTSLMSQKLLRQTLLFMLSNLLLLLTWFTTWTFSGKTTLHTLIITNGDCSSQKRQVLEERLTEA